MMMKYDDVTNIDTNLLEAVHHNKYFTAHVKIFIFLFRWELDKYVYHQYYLKIDLFVQTIAGPAHHF